MPTMLILLSINKLREAHGPDNVIVCAIEMLIFYGRWRLLSCWRVSEKIYLI